jgi:hypothetical protein
LGQGPLVDFVSFAALARLVKPCRLPEVGRRLRRHAGYPNER